MFREKRNTFNLIIFVVAILIVISLFSTLTLAYFASSATASGELQIAQLNFTYSGTINFGSTLLPDTTYTGSNYTTTIANTTESTS